MQLNRVLVGLFVAALTIRVVTYYVVNYILLDGKFFHPDSVYYQIYAVRFSPSWNPANWPPDLVYYPAYTNFIAPFYELLGPYRLIPELLNLVVGAFIPILVFYLGTNLFNHRVGLLSGIIATLDPLLIYESTQFLRDTILAGLVMVILLPAVLYRRYPIPSWILGSFCLLVLGFGLNRVPLVLAIFSTFLAGSFLSTVFRGRLTLPSWYITLNTGIVAGVTLFITRAKGQAGRLSYLEMINNYGERIANPNFTNRFFNELNTGIGPFQNWGELFLYLPIAGLKALFYPFPWLADTKIELAFSIYMVWWYGIIALALVGLVRVRWTWPRFLTLIFIGVLLVGLGMVGPVISGLIRWRLPVTLIVIIWASEGVWYLWYLVRKYETKKIFRPKRTTSSPRPTVSGLDTTMDSNSSDD